MADASPQDRIDAAIARIRAAIQIRDTDAAAFARRHDALRARVTEAIGAIDTLLDEEGAR